MDIRKKKKGGFLIYINGKMQCTNNIGLLEDGDGHFTNVDIDKMELLNSSFASVFNTSDGPKWCQCLELEGHGCENDELTVDTNVLRGLLFQSLGPEWVPPRLHKELPDDIMRPLSMTFIWS